LLLIFEFLIRDNYLNLYNHYLSMIILFLCLVAYLTSLFFIARVFHTIIKTRKIVDI
jgi:hypothetical protein